MDRQQIQAAFAAFQAAREHLKNIILSEKDAKCEKGELKWFALRAQDNLAEVAMCLSARVLGSGGQ